MSLLAKKMSDELRDRYEFARSRIHREKLLLYTALMLIFIMAFLIRMSTYFQWDPIIGGGGDTWSQLKAAQYMNQHGILGYFSYIDNTSWYPYGRNWGGTEYLGIPLLGVIAYHLGNLIGLHLSFEVAAFLAPGIVGGFTVVAIYFLGKEIGNEKIGLLAALFLSISPSHIQRSYAGFFDNEALGDLLVVLVLYFYLRSLHTGSFLDATWGGLSLGLLNDTWGGSTYVIQLISLFTIVLILLKKYSKRLFMPLAVMTMVSTIITVIIPRSGANFILNSDFLIPAGVIGLMMVIQLYQSNKKVINQLVSGTLLGMAGYLLFVLGILLFVINLFFGLIPAFQAKFISVLLPFLRSGTPILASVAEQAIVSWAGLYQNLFLLVFLIPIGIIYCYQKPTERNIFLLLFTVTGLYMAGSMARLILVLAPSSVIMGAKAIDETLIPYALVFQEKFFLSKRKKLVSVSIGNEHVGATFILFFAIIILQVFQGVHISQGILGPSDFLVPVTTSSSTTIQTLGDWQQVSQWFITNTDPGTTVIASWWDYGYWINVPTNRTIVVDPSTINSTQIGNIGALMMEPPDIALKIAQYYDINYLVAVVAQGYALLGSDIGKVQWMVDIAAQNSNLAPRLHASIVPSNYFTYDSLGNPSAFKPAFYDSTIWGLLTQGLDSTTYSTLTSGTNAFPLITQSSQYLHQGFSSQYSIYTNIYIPVYTTSNNWIRVWKIDWNAAAQLVGI